MLSARQVLALDTFSRSQPELTAFGTHGDGRSQLLYGEDIALGTLLNSLETGGDVTLAGDVTGTAGANTIAKLQGDAVPAKVANGFLKRNAANTAWEEVAYGILANTVAQGNDSRFPTATAAVTATGTDQAGAALLTTQISYVTGGNQATPNGVRLPPADSHIGETWMVFNAISGPSASAIGVAVFPTVADTILPLSANARDFLQPSMVGVYVSIGGGQWRAMGLPMKSDATTTVASSSWYFYQAATFVSGLTASGTLTINANMLTTMPVATPSGTTATVNWDTGISQVVDLSNTTGSTTITLSNPQLGGRYRLKVIGKTGRAATLSPAPKTAGGVPITWTAVDAAIDVAELLWDGSSYLLTSLQQNLS